MLRTDGGGWRRRGCSASTIRRLADRTPGRLSLAGRTPALPASVSPADVHRRKASVHRQAACASASGSAACSVVTVPAGTEFSTSMAPGSVERSPPAADRSAARRALRRSRASANLRSRSAKISASRPPSAATPVSVDARSSAQTCPSASHSRSHCEGGPCCNGPLQWPPNVARPPVSGNTREC